MNVFTYLIVQLTCCTTEKITVRVIMTQLFIILNDTLNHRMHSLKFTFQKTTYGKFFIITLFFKIVMLNKVKQSFPMLYA